MEKLIGSALDGDYVVAIINGEINIGINFLAHRAGTDPTRVKVYWKSKSPFSHGILNS